MNAVESALDSPQGHKGVHEYGIVQKQDLLDLVLLTRTEISKEDRSRVMVMITMDAHSRDTIADLVKQEVDDKGQFQWSRQLRQSYDYEESKYSKRRRSNVAVIIVRVIFISVFLFYCLLSNHSFPTNSNKIY